MNLLVFSHIVSTITSRCHQSMPCTPCSEKALGCYPGDTCECKCHAPSEDITVPHEQVATQGTEQGTEQSDEDRAQILVMLWQA
jgi:hypothetical protein